MPLPMRTSGLSGFAAADLGLGDMLGQQVAGETEEERKKKMKLQQERSLTGSPATDMLFGSTGGLGRGYGSY